MRAIKFRAWHKKRKKYYDVLHLHIASLLNGGIWATCKGLDIIDQKDIEIQIQPKDCIIEQFTGLTDLNGKEIFEGDIYTITKGLYYWKYVVKNWKSQGCCLCGVMLETNCNTDEDGNGFVKVRKATHEHYDTIPQGSRVETIGNIHQNPQLLEVTE